MSLTDRAAIVKASGGYLVGGAAQHPDITPVVPQPFQPATLVPAGTLSANNKADVLDIRQEPTSDGEDEVITARSGPHGTALWHVNDFEQPGDSTDIFTTDVGPSNSPGLLLVDSSSTPGADSTDPTTESLTIRAISGKGDPLWTRTISGTYTSSPETRDDLPFLGGVLRTGAHRPVEVVVDESSENSSGDYQTIVGTVSGSTGAVHQLTQSLSSDYSAPTFESVADLDGDGGDDLIGLAPGNAPVTAYDGRTDRVIWTSKPIDLTDPSRELTQLQAGSTPVLAFAQSGIITVLDGADGKQMWVRAGGDVFALGRAGPKRVPAIGIQDSSISVGTQTLTNTTELFAVDDSGHTIWKKTFSAHMPGNDQTGYTYADNITPVGDVQGDGSTDSILQVVISGVVFATGHQHYSPGENTQGLLDGRTGKLRRGPYEFGTAGSLHKGDVPDLASVTFGGSNSVATVTAWQGPNGKQYYSHKISAANHLGSVTASAARVSGHACSDILMTTENEQQTEISYDVLSARGHILWSLGFPVSSDYGGTLSKPVTPTNDCAS